MILKVCGITNAADAAAALAAGASAIGFNFYPKSPRYIEPERAAAIPTPGARRVGVFVNETVERIGEIACAAALDVAQLHGDEDVQAYSELEATAPLRSRLGGSRVAVWKALRVGEGFSLEPYLNLPVEALVLDGPAGELYGGAGRSFDWRLAAESGRRIVVAGGLDASNVVRAIALARPWGVDACSRIESAPGIKDHRKMTEFLLAARAALAA